MDTINTIGRRKASVARVYLSKGTGQITVNGKEFNQYFPQQYLQNNILDPLSITSTTKSYDLQINVHGGGFKGQAEAIRMGISRALVEANIEYKDELKSKKYLTRDSRVVERKKFGKPKARKSFQFSKR